jgi:hypothetical protein
VEKRISPLRFAPVEMTFFGLASVEMTVVWDCVERNANLRIVFCGLKDWNDGRLSRNLVDVGVGCFLLVLHQALDELGDGAFALCDPGDFGARGEDAEGGVIGDLFHGLGFGGGFGGLDFG